MANIGPWVSENTQTVGTGIITLSGAPDKSFTTFVMAVPVGDVWYSVEDSLTGNREEGIGAFSGGTQLDRHTIHSTLVDGVLTLAAAAPTAINLSGNAIVSCTFNTAAFDELSAAPVATAKVVMETVSNASLLPSTLVQQVPFEPRGHVGDSITVDHAGCIRVNEKGMYTFTATVQAFGILARRDRAMAYLGMKINGSFVGHYSYRLLTHESDMIMITHVDTIFVPAGSDITFEVYRDTEFSNSISFMPVAIDGGAQGSIPMAGVKVIKL